MSQAPIRSDGKPAHVWAKGSELGISPNSRLHNAEMCRNCGILRGSKEFPETPCRGRVRVELRSS